jgi:ornithine carbamoyltransferase
MPKLRNASTFQRSNVTRGISASTTTRGMNITIAAPMTSTHPPNVINTSTTSTQQHFTNTSSLSSTHRLVGAW